jgi:hypothetical protein
MKAVNMFKCPHHKTLFNEESLECFELGGYHIMYGQEILLATCDKFALRHSYSILEYFSITHWQSSIFSKVEL